MFVISLESWAPASSLTTFKLTWKTATLLALVTASIVLIYVLATSTFFLQHNTAIFIPVSGDNPDNLGHLPPQIHIESHPMLIFLLLFI